MKCPDNCQAEALFNPAPSGSDLHSMEPPVFTRCNHDDLVLAAERIRTSAGLHPVSASAAATGLKLLGAAMLSEHDNPLFDCLRASLDEFILNLNKNSFSPAPGRPHRR